MASSAPYQIAESDELTALGEADDGRFDTSAALGPDEDVNIISEPPPSKRTRCICITVAVFAILGAVLFVSIFFGLGSRGAKSSPVGNNDSSTTTPQTQPAAVSTPPGSAQAPGKKTPSTDVQTFSVSVLNTLPHDNRAFTQGFEYSNGVFYESTGLYGESTLRKVEIASGKVLQKYKLQDTTLFGEGITLHGDKHIFMLTWKAGRGFVFNQSSFEVVREWRYKGEGWGLTMDREKDEVYMSDGTSELRVLDPDTLAEKRRVKVTLRGKPVADLNEVEWVCGEVWANVWQTKNIYRIDPVSGVVNSIVDASSLPKKEDHTVNMDVLNGIAFDKESGRLWLTGKLWKVVYLVSISDSSLDLKSCK